MPRLGRLLLYLLLALGAVRAVLYFQYAAAMLPVPLESHNLEAKMVLLAYRAEQGLPLYPDWKAYPHVSNWFGPVNALAVGSLGRRAGGGIPVLFTIGRGLSFLAGLLMAVVLGVAVGRRTSRGAGLAAGVLSVGTGPMYGFTVMVRPDALAELLGLGGFLLCDARARTVRALGVGLLVLAILTKQTAAVYLLAAGLAPLLAGETRRGLRILAAAAAVLIGVAAVVNLGFEPHFADSLVGERIMPWDFGGPWRYLLYRIAITCPDILVLPLIGLGLWLGTGRGAPSYDIRSAVLTLLLLAWPLVLSGKVGADLNYFLCLRVCLALAVGMLWHVVQGPGIGTVVPRPKYPHPAALAAAAALAVVLVVVSLPTVLIYVRLSDQLSRSSQTPEGRRVVRSYHAAFALAQDPRVRLLTDSGLIDLYQGDRAAFGDPWLFCALVETGRLDPRTIAGRIESQYYDVIVTAHDLDSPAYFGQDFRLPRPLVLRLRARYVLRRKEPGLYVYGRRGPV